LRCSVCTAAPTREQTLLQTYAPDKGEPGNASAGTTSIRIDKLIVNSNAPVGGQQRDDQSAALSKAFSRIVGMAPGAFRKQKADAPANARQAA
jgi:hypothetical protein